MKRLLWLLVGAALAITGSVVANDFFNPSGVPSTGAPLVSATIRTEFSNIGAGFDKLPTLTGNGNKVVTINAGGTALTATAATALSGLTIGSNIQAWDADLDAIAALGTTGFPARTAANTWSLRTITGTANEIDVSNGAGVAGNPTLSLPSTLTLTGKTVTADTQAIGDSSTKVATTAFVQAAIPAGTMLDFAGTAAPTGYLACDGSTVSRTTYATLFAAIGTTWNTGGEAGTDFRLPDFRRRVAVGSGGSGTATLGNAVGNRGGAETHTLASSEMPSHQHTFSGTTTGQSADHTHQFNVTGVGGAGTPFLDGNGVTSTVTTTGASNDHTHDYSGTTAATGGGGAHNIMQPSAVVLKIIKY